MAKLFLAPEEGALDHIDLLRHTLGNCIVPATVETITEAFNQAAREKRVLPSGREHREIAMPAELLEELVRAGYVKKFVGFNSHHELNAATVRDTTVVDHPESGSDVQPETRGEIWAALAKDAFKNPSVEHYLMTKIGFEALTGHPQGG